MNVKQLKEKLCKYKDNSPVVLLDLTTDDELDCVYSVNIEDISSVDVISNDDDSITNAFCINFKNKLNNNPI